MTREGKFAFFVVLSSFVCASSFSCRRRVIFSKLLTLPVFIDLFSGRARVKHRDYDSCRRRRRRLHRKSVRKIKGEELSLSLSLSLFPRNASSPYASTSSPSRFFFFQSVIRASDFVRVDGWNSDCFHERLVWFENGMVASRIRTRGVHIDWIVCLD